MYSLLHELNNIRAIKSFVTDKSEEEKIARYLISDLSKCFPQVFSLETCSAHFMIVPVSNQYLNRIESIINEIDHVRCFLNNARIILA